MSCPSKVLRHASWVAMKDRLFVYSSSLTFPVVCELFALLNELGLITLESGTIKLNLHFRPPIAATELE